MKWPQWMASANFAPEEITEKTRRIYETLLAQSRYLDGGNFELFHRDDLALLYAEYDRLFFNGHCQQLLGDRPLDFRLSSRMTRAGGKTTRTIWERHAPQEHYEISVSSTLLFQTFDDIPRTVVVTGIECHDRLEALQRIFEHELVHLLEMLLWKKSKCAAERFQTIAHRYFGHTAHTHQLITPRERALKRFGIRAGSRVRFHFEGREFIGRVNRITQRATVLVESNQGARYSDGKHYEKFYIPLPMLEPLDGDT